MAFTSESRLGLTWTQAENLGTVNAFSTRLGGVSRGHLAGLNLGESAGDDVSALRENWRLFTAALGLSHERLVFSKQVHGCTVRTVTSRDIHTPGEPVPWQADALVTNEPGLSLCIVWADCVPVLLHDPVRRVCAAAHSGWRGTAQNIAGETVRAMRERFGCRPEDIRAAIGPCICRSCYQVGQEVADAMHKLPVDVSSCVGEKDGRLTADLRGIVGLLLQHAGLAAENIETSTHCTACSGEDYWSHRRMGAKRGLQAAVIALADAL